MNSEAIDVTGAPLRKSGLGFWLGVVVASLVVAVWTATATIGITFPTAETAPPDPTTSLAFQMGAVARAPLMVGFVLWTLCWALFWRLPSLRSALLGLLILVVVGFAIALPVRLSLATSLSGEDLVATNFIQSTTTQVEDVVSDARERAAEIGLDANVPQSGWTRELIEARLQHLQQALPSARTAMERLDSVRQTSAAAIAALDVSESTRSRVTRQLEWVVGPSPSVVEAFRSELLVIEKSEEQFSYLGANASGWDVQGGQIAFRSERVLRRFNKLGEELTALAAAMNATTQAMQTKRQSSMASSPFDTTPRIFESVSPSFADQVKRVSSWSYLMLMRAMTSVVGAAFFALLATPIMKLSARSTRLRRTLMIAFRAFLPAVLGISLSYAVYVDILGKRPGETPAYLLLAWLVLAGWLISRGMKQEGVVRRFPGIGTRVIFGLFALSWAFVGLAYMLRLLSGLP